MSFGKYGFKKTGNQGNKNSDMSNFANAAYNDPWFALGQLIGQSHTQNWNERDYKKNAAILDNALSGNGQQGQAAAAPSLGLISSLAGTSQQGGQESYDLSRYLQNITQAPQASAAPQQEMNNPQGQGQLSNYAQQGDHPNNNIQIDPRNFVSSLNAFNQQQMPQMPERFNADLMLAQKIKEVKANGANPETIDQLVKVYGPLFKASEAEINKRITDNLVNEIKNYNPQNGYSPEAMATMAQLAQYNPTVYQAMQPNVVTGQAAWLNKAKEENADRNLYRQKDIAGYNTELRKGLIDYTNDSGVRAFQNKADAISQGLIKAGVPVQDAYAAAYGIKKGTGSGGGSGISAQSIAAAKAILASTEGGFSEEERAAARKVLSDASGYKDAVPADAQLQAFIGKYNDIRSKNSWDSATLNQALVQDSELINYLKANPNAVPLFERQTGIRLPRKQ